ncbi:MAG: hypothetical protein K9M57_06430 [Phycisphaerae bacterium]|nr:hypothetical protein [Phycisphaerae bacterium]
MKNKDVKIKNRLLAVMPLNRWMALIAILLASTSLIFEYGLENCPIPRNILLAADVLSALLILGGKVYKWVLIHRQSLAHYRPLWDMALLVALLISFMIAPRWFVTIDPAYVRWISFKIYLLILIMTYWGRFSVTVAAKGPTRAMVLSFALIITLGSTLLMLPHTQRIGRLGFTDAVFTATSATCVTGLVVCDTGGDFTRLGQSVILALIQIGGLGIMIFGATFAFLIGSQLSLRESVAMQDIMNEQSPGRVGRIAVFICIITFTIELIGVFCLYGMWDGDPVRGGRLFQSLFHSISAFCNAGFSLQADSLIGQHDYWRVYTVMCPLIIVGGLGFPVLYNLWGMAIARIKRLLTGKTIPVKQLRLTLHSKIVLIATACLLLGGWGILLVLEIVRPDRMAHPLSVVAVLDSLFNAITARTAGFNTMEMNHLSASSKLVMIVLMMIGGSPSSTAGGLKTVTFVVMALAIYATIRRRQQVHIFKRSVPVLIIRRAATFIMLYVMSLWLLTLLLTITEHSLGADILDLLFESASALGTVGLSTGVTEHLSTAGKWVIIAGMFIGRLGPLGLLVALTFNIPPHNYDYPSEPLVIG